MYPLVIGMRCVVRPAVRGPYAERINYDISARGKVLRRVLHGRAVADVR